MQQLSHSLKFGVGGQQISIRNLLFGQELLCFSRLGLKFKAIGNDFQRGSDRFMGPKLHGQQISIRNLLFGQQVVVFMQVGFQIQGYRKHFQQIQ